MACVVACIVVWLYSFRIYRLFLAMFPYFRDCYSFPLVIPRSAYFSCHLCLTFRICHATYCLNQNYDFKNQIGPTDPTIHRSNLVHIFGPDNFWISLKLPESTIELVNQLIWSVLDEPNGSKEFFFFFVIFFKMTLFCLSNLSLYLFLCIAVTSSAPIQCHRRLDNHTMSTTMPSWWWHVMCRCCLSFGLSTTLSLVWQPCHLEGDPSWRRSNLEHHLHGDAIRAVITLTFSISNNSIDFENFKVLI